MVGKVTQISAQHFASSLGDIILLTQTDVAMNALKCVTVSFQWVLEKLKLDQIKSTFIKQLVHV